MAHNLRAGLNERADVEGLFDELELAGLDLRHVENVVDDMEQVLAALMNHACIVPIALLPQSAKQLPIEDLRESDHGVERRPELMAHIGEELRLGAGGALCLIARPQ